MKKLLILLLTIPLLINAQAVICKHGSSLHFDSSYVEIPDTSTLHIPRDLTLEVWVKVDSLYLETVLQLGGSNNTAVISLLGTEYYGTYGIENCAHFGVVEAATNTQYDVFSPNNSIEVGKWYHIIGERKGDSIFVYLDGVKYGASGFTGNNRYGGNSFIGFSGDSVSYPEWTKGYEKGARIYNRAISDLEVQWNDRHLRAVMNPAGLVLRLKMDEYSGDTTYDYSGEGNNGVLVSSPKWMIDVPTIVAK